MKAIYFIKHLVGTSLFFATLFFSAGKFINYWQGLIYSAIGFIMMIASYTILKIDSNLQSERANTHQNTENWDKLILGLSFITTIAMFITAGLDSGRFGWSPKFHWGFYLIGALFTAAGQLIFLVAQKQNKFFSSTVRIQSDREHRVCNTGLYQFVRHPAYLGSIIQSIGFPLLLGSLWSIIPATASVILLVLRTFKEDEYLKTNLTGYIEYTKKTTNRICPYIW